MDSVVTPCGCAPNKRSQAATITLQHFLWQGLSGHQVDPGPATPCLRDGRSWCACLEGVSQPGQLEGDGQLSAASSKWFIQQVGGKEGGALV